MRTVPALLLLAACDGVPRNVEYFSDVQPILEDHCVRCHQPGGVGPIDLTDPAIAASWSEVIAEATRTGAMPPPVSDPECRDYLGSEHLAVSDRDRRTLARWAERGAPMGDRTDATPGTEQPTTLEDADLHVRIPPFAPTYDDPNNPGNEYRCFVLDHGRDSDFFVTGLDAEVDQQAIVHHMVLAAVDRSALPADFDREHGEDCISDDMGAIEHMLAAWAPGSEPQVFQPGTGMRVGVDQVLLLQMHYYRSSAEVVGLSDQSGYALRTAPSVDTRLEVLTLGSSSFRIPANDPDYRFGEGWRTDRDLMIHGIFPHMHALGSGYRMWVDDDRPKDCLVASEGYDFHNQITYLFREPVPVASGRTLNWECAWNNAADNPDRLTPESSDVFYGEGSDAEMCFFFTIVEAGSDR
ncbi:MAG: hypothetical protein R3F61_02425 [Myxococcota bacterium]